MRTLFRLGAVLGALALTGCGSTRNRPPPPPAAAEGPTPGHGIGIYKIGQPYQVNGIWYYPTQDLAYDETGIASWYGPGFHENYTANGEVFDQNEVTAAHKILPLPAIVQVTNLDNGRSIQVRVNDRGPYAVGRIIDMSRRAAQLLGFEQIGTAKVRVKLLVPETIQAQSLAKLNGTGGPQLAAEPAPAASPREAVVAQALPPPNAAQPPPARELAPPPPQQQPLPAPTLAVQGKPVPPGPPLTNTVAVLPVRPTQIYVQAGAYSSNANADRMRAKLASVGPVKVIQAHVNGINVFRVRLGPIATVDDADTVLQSAISAGASESRIVVD